MTTAERLGVVHRVGAVAFELVLGVFGTPGLVDRLAMFSITGGRVLGLSSNGLLSVISLVVAAVCRRSSSDAFSAVVVTSPR